MSSGDDGDQSSNADEGSEENRAGIGNDNVSVPIDTDYSSELTSDGRKTTSSSPTETDSNDYEDDYYDDDDDYDDYDDSETSDDRKPSPKVQNEEENSGDAASDARNLSSSNRPNQNVESFPCTLFLMLNNETEAGGKSIKWLPGGEGFEIIDQNALEKDILPKYFPSSCMFQSFVRRLYRWGFLQIGKRKPGHYIFSNEGFHRDNELYKQLKAKPRPRGNNQAKPSTGGDAQDGSFEPVRTTLPSARMHLAMPTNDGNITSTSVELPSQLAMAQSEVTSQLNSIISSYSNNPIMLTALQNTLSSVLNSHITFGAPQNPVAPNASLLQQVSSLSSQSMPRQVENSFGPDNQVQLPGSEIVQNVLRFLTQEQQMMISRSHAAAVQPPHLQYAPSILPAMPQPHYAGEPVLQGNDPNMGYASSHYSVDPTTTNTSTSSQAEYEQNDFETSEPDNNDRKRQRSPSPQD